MRYWPHRAASAPFASSHRQARTPALTGAGNSASITITKPGVCEDSSATIATSLSATPSPKPPHALWSNTSDFTTERIASIEPAGVAEVFDIQVAHTENFIANGLVSHNTRWHHDDLAGRLLAAQAAGGDRWEVLHLPAIAADGSALWPEKYDRPALDRIKGAVGSRVFAALYQGQPSNDDTALLKREWWKFYGGPTGHALPRYFDQSLQSWDMTFKGGVNNDFVAGQIWEKAGADCYLTDRVKARLDFPATLGAMRAMAARRPDVLLKLVEDTANGPAVIATLEHELPGIVPVRPEGGKIARVNAIAGLVEAGNVWLPHPSIAPWVTEFIEEATAFPTGAHDDEVDAASQALVRLSTPPADIPYRPGSTGVRR